MTRSETGESAAAPSPERIAELVKSLASVMRQSDMTELDLDVGSVSVRLRRPGQGVDPALIAVPEPNATGMAELSTHAHIITAPMIGTFYGSPTPGTKPFVGEGDEIVVGQTIGIIEAMKIMNEIAADRSGTVEDVLVSNGQPVEYGSPLLQLSLSRGERS